MRLLTHNTLRNNAADAKGKGFPLKITAQDIRVDSISDDARGGTVVRHQALAFVRSSVLNMLDWNALVQVSAYVTLCLYIYEARDENDTYMYINFGVNLFFKTIVTTNDIFCCCCCCFHMIRYIATFT
jgi:hypothetical protein